jgi:two-component system NarL family response regulator
VIRQLRVLDPSARIIVLTVLQGDEDIFRALEAGAVTYLLKDTLSADLVRVIREVHAGRRPLREDLQERLAERAAARLGRRAGGVEGGLYFRRIRHARSIVPVGS